MISKQLTPEEMNKELGIHIREIGSWLTKEQKKNARLKLVIKTLRMELKLMPSMEMDIHNLSIALCKEQCENTILKDRVRFKDSHIDLLKYKVDLYLPAYIRWQQEAQELFKDVKEEINLLTGEDDE